MDSTSLRRLRNNKDRSRVLFKYARKRRRLMQMRDVKCDSEFEQIPT
ncbi:hypothetical protein SAMN05414139_09448 [Burkholderia sp. D7]|nr:hypothetical protein SAMN05414139_09448 [Burkholderia sp. D7]